MRKAILLLCVLCSLSPVFAQQDADGTIFKAMRDEGKITDIYTLGEFERLYATQENDE